MKMQTLDDVLRDQLKDLYSAENQLLKALPKMARKATTPQLAEAIKAHRQETENQVTRLEQIGENLKIKLSGQKCLAMAGLIEEGEEAINAKGNGVLIDALLIAAAQRVEHYEMAAYGTARALAEQLGHTKEVQLLEETLNEEKSADNKLNEIVMEIIYPQVKQSPEGEEEAANSSTEPAHA